MSRIGELIREKCPVGVEYKKIADICLNICSGGTPNSKNESYYMNGTIPWLRTQEINFGEISTTELLITEDALNNSSAKWIPKDCVIVAMYGATVGKIAINKIPLTTNQACCNLEINPKVALYKYVFYCLSNQYMYIKSLGQGSQTNINAQIVKNLEIPVPPIEVQQEIVHILDKFTELEKELQAELDARKKQYEHYRDELLTFDENVSVVRLDEISDIYDSLHTTPAYIDTGYSMIRVADVKSGYVDTSVALKVDEETYKQYTKKYKPQFNDIIISRVGSFGNTCLIGTEDVCLGQNIALIHSKISAKYLYYYLNTTKVRAYFDGSSNGAAYKNLSLARIKETPIAVPDIEIQNKIVAVLEKMDAISGNTENGLPAEIMARHKHYEYYRDKLLSFKRVGESV